MRVHRPIRDQRPVHRTLKDECHATGQTVDKIEFSKEEKEIVVRKIQLYFKEELDQEIGSFDAEFLLDFLAGEFGGFFYNRGLADAEVAISAKLGQWNSDRLGSILRSLN